MRESRTSGSVRGDRGNSVPYRHKIDRFPSIEPFQRVSVSMQQGVSKHDPLRGDLCDAQGGLVMIVLARHDSYHGQVAHAEIDADQRPLPLTDQPQEDGAGVEPESTES